jgi:hypothetical protein
METLQEKAHGTSLATSPFNCLENTYFSTFPHKAWWWRPLLIQIKNFLKIPGGEIPEWAKPLACFDEWKSGWRGILSQNLTHLKFHTKTLCVKEAVEEAD